MGLVGQKESLNVGVKNSYFTFVATETPETLTYETETYYSPNIKNITITPEGEGQVVTGSNTVYEVVWGSKSITVAIDMLAVEQETQAKLLGREFLTGANGYGVSSLTENGRPMKTAFTTEMPNNDGTTIFACFPVIQAMKEIEVSVAEMGGGYSESSQTYEFKGMTAPMQEALSITSTPVKAEHVEALRLTWHQTPPQTPEDALALLEALPPIV